MSVNFTDKKNNMNIERLELVFLFILFYTNSIISLTRVSQLESNANIEITSEILKLYKQGEIQKSHSDHAKFKKVTQEQCAKCTVLKRSIDQILPRSKRFLIYPSASNLVVTMSLVKALTFNTPRGYNYLGEIDLYYPLPDKVMHPHHHTTTTTTTTEAPPSPMSTQVFDYHHSHLPAGWDSDRSAEIFMPDGRWKDDIFQNINDIENTNNSSRRYWNENLSYRNSYSNSNPPSFHSKLRRRFDFIKPMQPYRGKRSIETEVWDNISKGGNNNDAKQAKSHRDRRDLYSQMESIFKYKGIKIRTCILRAICEAKHFLLPAGKSLFHDIFRILFTIPTTNEINDVYSNSARSHDDSENCWKLYENDCPLSILDLLLKSQKIL